MFRNLNLHTAVFLTIFVAGATAQTSTIHPMLQVGEFYSGAETGASVIEKVLAAEARDLADAPPYIVTVEQSSVTSGNAISILEKLPGTLGYWHMPPDAFKFRVGASASELSQLQFAAFEQLVVGFAGFGLATIVSQVQAHSGETFGAPENAMTVRDFSRSLALHDIQLILAIRQSQPEARTRQNAFDDLKDLAVLDRIDRVGGREAWYLKAGGIRHTQTMGQGGDVERYTIHRMELWVDVQSHLISGMRFEGESQRPGREATSFEVTTFKTAFSEVPNYSFRLPAYQQMFLRLGGMTPQTDPETAEKLRQAQRGLETLRQRYERGEIPQNIYETLKAQIERSIGMIENLTGTVAGSGIGVETHTVKMLSFKTPGAVMVALARLP